MNAETTFDLTVFDIDENTGILGGSQVTSDDTISANPQNNRPQKAVQEPPKNSGAQPEDEAPTEPAKSGLTPQETEQHFETPTEGVEVFKAMGQQWFEHNGWDWDENLMEDDSPEALNELFNKVIGDLAQPEYASDEVKAFDEYVKNGGDPRKFLQTYYGESQGEYEVDSVSGQREVVERHLQLTTNWSDAKIAKEIKRLESSDSLEDEAKEAYQAVLEIEAQERQQIIEQQRRAAAEAYQREQQYVQQQADYIMRATNEELGVEMSKREREKFLDYLFATDPNTKMTEYQKVLSTKPQIEIKMAALAFKGALDGKLPQIAKNKAADDFRKVLTANQPKWNKNSSVEVRFKTSPDDANLSAFDF